MHAHPQPSYFSRIGCLLRYCKLDPQGSGRSVFSFTLRASSLKLIQNESCDLNKGNRRGGVWAKMIEEDLKSAEKSEGNKVPTILVANLGKYSCFCCSVPNLSIIVLIKVFWISQSTLTEASTLASSSITKIDEKKEASVPSYFVSTSIPINCN